MEVLGIGHSYGDITLDNDFIESLDTGTTKEWILEKIGINQRRATLPKDYIVTTRNKNPGECLRVRTKSWLDLSLEACDMAFSRSNLSPADIDLILVDCVTPDNFFPIPSQELKDKLGCFNAYAFDLVTACPAAALHLYFASRLQVCWNTALLVTSATVSHAVNYNDRTDGAIWGDGAGSIIVSKKRKGKLRLIDTTFSGDPTRAESVIIHRRGHFWQDGRAVRNFSVRQTVRMIKEISSKYGLDFTKDIFIGHQANLTMLRQIGEAAGVPDENNWKNVERCGNQAAAGAIASLSERWDSLPVGRKILIAVLGAGLTWGTALFDVIS